MELLLNEKAKELLDLLLQIPPKTEEAEKLIRSANYSDEELSRVAVRYAEACSFNISDARCEKGAEIRMNSLGIAEGFHSTYLYEVLALLLSYGVDVNAVLEDDTCRYNIMSSVMWVDNGYAAADSMRLLLENGGDPNLIVDGESVFDELTFDIFYGAIEQENRRLYENWVHTWLVLLAFGGKGVEGRLFRECGQEEPFTLSKLKEHRNYDVCLSRGEDGPIVRIFDKRTFWEVACF